MKKEDWKVELFNRVMGELMSRKIENVKQFSTGMNSYPYSSSSSSLLLTLTDDHDDLHPLNFPTISQSSSPCNNNNNNGGRKRKRKEDKELEKPKEVIHVRAKRGQATDSHSLAERVRREKINEKLRCLQDLVPGCYKTMGMAVMLDVIIHYVQSLQHQIEFLSMKLTAASMHHDFNLERDNLETTQQATNAYELQEIERMERDQGYGGPPNYFHSADWAL